MNIKFALAGVLLAGFVTPTLAADSFYIVQDSSTKKCTIVKEKPTVTSMTVVGDGTVYTTETEAQSAMKTTKVCTSN